VLRLRPKRRGVPEDLAEREETDGPEHDIDPLLELVDAIREPQLAGLVIEADEAESEAEECREDRLRRGGAGQTGDRAQCDDHDGEQLGRSELHRLFHQDRGEDHETDRRERAGDERPDGARCQRRTSASPLRHLVAVDRGDDGR
jgi:hypothetical protein